MYQQNYQPNLGFSAFPPVIKNLLIINGLVFLAQFVPSTNYLLTNWFALWPLDFSGTPRLPGSGQFWPWQLLTYGFLHAGVTHILFNMFGLWMFGVQLENAWGSNRFLVFYVVSVVGAGLIQLAVVTFSGEFYPTVGASGGVFGLLMAFGMMFPNQPIYLYFLFPIPAKYFVILFGILELYLGVQGGTNIANFAHLGGMLFAFLLIQYWRGKLPIQPERRMYW
ncbi:MAG: rhomboid family intramembrane serine protease [Rhodothermales bacterium]|nr:rhomboid family intramembrane serine protease [Rhodothermales bacterium]MBO6781081.1 rhomboid family intramembrane serine protease [Rhodothermales bacterium]